MHGLIKKNNIIFFNVIFTRYLVFQLNLNVDMKRANTKKKESGAEGRKRRKLEPAEAEKSRNIFVPFFKTPAPFVRTAEAYSNTQAIAPQGDGVVTPSESANDNGRREATGNNSIAVKDNSDSGNPKLSSNDSHPGSIESENTKLYRSQSQGSALPEFITEHDIGLLNFSKDTGLPITYFIR